MRRLWLACIAMVGAACATGRPLGARGVELETYAPFGRTVAREEPPASVEVSAAPLDVMPGARDQAVAEARRLVGKSAIVVNGRRFGDDCTGLVRAVYSQVGIDLMGDGASGDNGVTAIWRFAARHGRTYTGGRPVAGDLVFFRETYDVNRDGALNDGLTHIGLVDEVAADGTVTVIHRVARGVVRYRMNLNWPSAQTSPEGRPVNDWLRAAAPGSKPQLTAELFAGYATLLPVEARYAEAPR